jgi:indolepyruvate ferredoxin oxidoreductase alpha subunit
MFVDWRTPSPLAVDGDAREQAPFSPGISMERSFSKEIKALSKGDGEVFEGEGILAITKALLQAGVSYVGGYQGSPISHLVDVLADAKPLLDELGVYFELSANEAAAAAMLGASINYPMRGAAVWKSTVGTNVASDALANLASAGVIGGAVIIAGEDYGEGASIIQERTHAYAMKSSMWLMDPRPDHTRMVEMIERAFELSEASNTPVITEFRIRACHVHGSFVCKDNRRPAISTHDKLTDPTWSYDRLCQAPATFLQERLKIEQRFPAAIDFIRSHRLNELFAGRREDIGIVVQGGLYNTLLRALQRLGLADTFGATEISILALNVTYPLVPDEITSFCAGKRAVLVVEEGFPEFIEDAIGSVLRRADLQTRLIGKQVFPRAGEYTIAVMVKAIGAFLEGLVLPGIDLVKVGAVSAAIDALPARAAALLGTAIPKRPPGFCIGCPERPIFSAVKLIEREFGKIHMAADIGCHSFSVLPPFSLGNSILGYGMSLASASALAPMFGKRVISMVGDGGFWHNGLTSGVTAAVTNEQDSILIVANNGYASATGQQRLPSSRIGGRVRVTIEAALQAMGVRWVRTIRSYSVGRMMKSLRAAMLTKDGGLKVIVAEGECQLARQRRIKPQLAKALAAGKRTVRTRFGVDEDVCTGDHSCIRLSGCPSLTVKDTADLLRQDPVAHVNNDCVGCGNCGEVADAAVLCPSFYQVDVVQNPGTSDRLLAGLRNRVIATLQRAVTSTITVVSAE